MRQSVTDRLKGGLTRRAFLAGAATAVSGPQVVSAATLGRGGGKAPSERIGMGFIGVGGRGTSHVHTLMHYPDVQICALCDPFAAKCEEARKQVEKHYADTGRSGAKDCQTCSDFREVLARDDIDAVVVASPEYWHALHGARAAEAGKDVYGEKALTLTVREGRALVDKVRRYGCVYQVGMQQRSAKDFRFACELARNGYLGKLHTIQVGVPAGRALPEAPPAPVPPNLDYEMWLGPAPYTPYNELKCTYNWYFIYDYCVGWIQSWGVHHLDIARWGAPGLSKGLLKVKGTAVFPEAGLADTSITWRVECRTENGLLLSFSDNGHHEQGCRFEGDEGWVHVNRSGIKAQPAGLLDTTIKPDEEHLYSSKNHHDNFLECIRSRNDPAAKVEDGHASNVISILADIATRRGTEITWDWERETCIGDDEANRMLSRSMRSPWVL